jgi:hypothetical protein
MRTITIPTQTVSEAIQSYDHFVGFKVNIVVGVGQEVDGQFAYTIPQQFQSYVIQNQAAVTDAQGNVLRAAITDYNDLMNQYPDGNFGTEDLWPYIDRIRNRS